MQEVERLRAGGASDDRIAKELLGGEGATRWLTGGEVSKRNLVRSARR
jgi:hypothetical protein